MRVRVWIAGTDGPCRDFELAAVPRVGDCISISAAGRLEEGIVASVTWQTAGHRIRDDRPAAGRRTRGLGDGGARRLQAFDRWRHRGSAGPHFREGRDRVSAVRRYSTRRPSTMPQPVPVPVPDKTRATRGWPLSCLVEPASTELFPKSLYNQTKLCRLGIRTPRRTPRTCAVTADEDRDEGVRGRERATEVTMYSKMASLPYLLS